MGALISFIGGSVFRMLWGEISSLWTSHQEHRREIELMRVQAEIDGQAHGREMESLKLQASLGIKVIEKQGEIALENLDAQIFKSGVELTGRSTGIKWIDAWNASIKAALATEMMILVTMFYYHKNWMLDSNGWELAGAVFGVYIADRLLFRRGK